MEEAKIRETVRDKLAAGELPRELGAVVIISGTGGSGQLCSGCEEVIKPSDTTPICYEPLGTRHWFHQLCEKIWQEERHKLTPV
jgi:hypothetical protein